MKHYSLIFSFVNPAFDPMGSNADLFSPIKSQIVECQAESVLIAVARGCDLVNGLTDFNANDAIAVTVTEKLQ